jgi:hypothetical protein
MRAALVWRVAKLRCTAQFGRDRPRTVATGQAGHVRCQPITDVGRFRVENVGLSASFQFGSVGLTSWSSDFKFFRPCSSETVDLMFAPDPFLLRLRRIGALDPTVGRQFSSGLDRADS